NQCLSARAWISSTNIPTPITCRNLLRKRRSTAPASRLRLPNGAAGRSGTMFWSWQDLPQFSRIDDEMCNGILESGVVTEAREPRDVVSMELSRLFTLQRHVDERPGTA